MIDYKKRYKMLREICEKYMMKQISKPHFEKEYFEITEIKKNE